MKKDGSVWAWGNNYYGQLGNGSPIIQQNLPQRVLPPGSDVIAVTAGMQHALALKKDGSVWAWGLNNAGQLGDSRKWTAEEAKLDDPSKVPKRVSPIQVLPSGGGVIALAAANDHSLAWKADGGILEWGNTKPDERWVGMTAAGKVVPTLIPAFTLSVNPK